MFRTGIDTYFIEWAKSTYAGFERWPQGIVNVPITQSKHPVDELCCVFVHFRLTLDSKWKKIVSVLPFALVGLLSMDNRLDRLIIAMVIQYNILETKLRQTFDDGSELNEAFVKGLLLELSK